MKLMFAYGANLNVDGMKRRCPLAVPVGPLWLSDARLVFRGVADCVYEKGSTCPGGLWLITERCERALDSFEGCRPDGSGSYRKVTLPVEDCPHGDEMFYYAMNSTGIYPPYSGYLACIREGYRDFGLDADPLDAAVAASHREKAPTEREYARLSRDRARRADAARAAVAVRLPAFASSLFPEE